MKSNIIRFCEIYKNNGFTKVKFRHRSKNNFIVFYQNNLICKTLKLNDDVAKSFDILDLSFKKV